MVKLRKSWPLLVSVLSPICQVVFIFALFWFSDAVVKRFTPGHRFWLDLNFSAWNLFVLPAMAAIVSELSWAQDRDASIWRHLLHQPVSRVKQYLAKTANHFLLFFISLSLVFGLVFIGGLILQKNPEFLMMQMQTKLFFQFYAYSFLASLPVVAFTTWFSFRFPGPGMALGAALVGSWASMKLIGITSLVQMLPWGLSCHAATTFERWRFALPWDYCFGSMFLTIALVVFGAIDFSKLAYTKSLERN